VRSNLALAMADLPQFSGWSWYLRRKTACVGAATAASSFSL
jgi:hypothetical protein